MLIEASLQMMNPATGLLHDDRVVALADALIEHDSPKWLAPAKRGQRLPRMHSDGIDHGVEAERVDDTMRKKVTPADFEMGGKLGLHGRS